MQAVRKRGCERAAGGRQGAPGMQTTLLAATAAQQPHSAESSSAARADPAGWPAAAAPPPQSLLQGAYLAPLPSTVLRAPPPPAGQRAAPPAHADGMPSAFSAFRRAAPHAAPQVHEQHMMLLCRLALAHFLSCHMSHCFLASRTRRSCEPTIGLPAHSCLSSPRLPVSMSQWQYCSSPPAWPIPGARATGRLRRAS